MGQRDKERTLAPIKAIMFLEDPPAFSERGNVFFASFVSGNAGFEVGCTPHTLLCAIERATRAYNEWATANREAQVVRRGCFREDLRPED